ncbi:glycosyltransferase family 2 protein [Derxia gummosa]|uniref:Glycosyltransferase family 2 protein n=1 Tax=Derxia gummosa DSM 723 TaxID=1121388 RepID=A0A8B6XBT2_9BURK|nr:glycosyltransferase family 2 protein [Derxia gummosa]
MNQAVPASAPSLSIVIPLYHESGNVLPLVDRVHAALGSYAGPWELILVNDGSRDATQAEAEQARDKWGSHVRPLELARNLGQTAAMQAGIDAARGELIATLDGDLQNDPADIPGMVKALIERKLDLLCGRRANRKDGLILRKIPSRIANRLIGRMTGIRISDYGCSLKIYRAAMIKRVRLYGEMHRLIPVWAAMVTSPQRIGEMDVSHHARMVGQSKYGISRTFRVILDLLTVFFFMRFQARPGHFFGSLGLIFGAVGGTMMTWLAFLKLVMGESIGGRPMFFTAMLLLMFAAQFITTGLVSEMLTRVFQPMRPTPLTDASPVAGDAGGWHLLPGMKAPAEPAVTTPPAMPGLGQTGGFAIVSPAPQAGGVSGGGAPAGTAATPAGTPEPRP